MDNYRRRPPMEGFSRPGELGGEAFDDDSVEGHIMDERNDQPGDKFRFRVDQDDTEGHRNKTRIAGDDDDTEGHLNKTR